MLALLDLVPKWVWAALVAALSATSCKLKLENGELYLEIEKGKTYANALAASIANATAIAEKSAREDMERVQQAESSARLRVASLERDRNSARAELGRLQLALQERSSGSSSGAPKTSAYAPAEYSDPTADLLLQCSSRYIELAGKTDGYVNDIKTLTEAWPK